MRSPLGVLEEIAFDDDADPKARVAAAKSLAEYTDRKLQPQGGVEAQVVNITMEILPEVSKKRPESLVHVSELPSRSTKQAG